MELLYTDHLKKILQLSRKECNRLNNDYVGTEHLLLGILKDGNNAAINIMKHLNVDIDKLYLNISKRLEQVSSTFYNSTSKIFFYLQSRKSIKFGEIRGKIIKTIICGSGTFIDGFF